MPVRPQPKSPARLSKLVARLSRAAVEVLEVRQLLSSYFVSTTGSDQGSGTLQAPFRTIQEAANVAQPGDDVFIEGGTYNETVIPLSGQSGAPITFEAYNGETVVISGTDPITGWSNYQGSVYQASMPANMGTGQNQVFVDGQALNEARWPASSLDLSDPTYANADSITSHIANGVNASTATLNNSSLTQPAGFWDGATIRFDPGQGWASQTGTVISSSPGSVTFDFTSDAPTRPFTNPTAGDPFTLIGTAGALDAPGEFYRSDSGTLYLQTPASDNPAGHDIEVQDRKYGFNLSGKSYVNLQGLTFFACSIATDSGSRGLVLSHLDIEHANQINGVSDPWATADDASNSALVLDGSNNTLQDSTVAFSAGNGVVLAGLDNTVQGCTVHDVDYTGANFAGITSVGSTEQILDNVVYNSGRDGMRVSSSGGVQIIDNVVHDVMLQTTDGGGIYTFGTDGSSSRIAYNQVYNVNAGGYGAAGIYLDNFDSNWTVDNNTVWNCTFALKLNPPNSHDHIYDNSLEGSLSVETSGSGAMPGTVFSDNIFYDAAKIGPGAVQQDNAHGGVFTPPASAVPDPGVDSQAGPPSSTPNWSSPSDAAGQAPARAQAPARPNPQIAIDAQAVATDVTQVRADVAARAAALNADQAAIRSQRLSAALATSNNRTTLLKGRAADVAAVKATAVADKAAILAVLSRIRADRHNPAALTADHGALLAAEAKYATDNAAGNALLRNDVAQLKSKSNSALSITSPALAALKADEAKWASIIAAAVATFHADQAKLKAASG